MIENYKRLIHLVLCNNDLNEQKKKTYILYYKRKDINGNIKDLIPIQTSDSKEDLIHFLRYKTNENYDYLKKHNLKNSKFYIESITD